MKCSDISTARVLETVRLRQRPESGVASTWDVIEDLALEGAVAKVVQAKLYNLIRKGRLHGCVHGTVVTCRGDLHVPVPGVKCPLLCGATP